MNPTIQLRFSVIPLILVMALPFLTKVGFAQITHTYPGPGTYQVCGKLYYFNPFQQLDSCVICKSLVVPVPFNPCNFYSVEKLGSNRTDIFEPIELRGYLYEISDRVHFQEGTMHSVEVQVFDSNTDTLQLSGILTPGSESSLWDFNLTLFPGPKTNLLHWKVYQCFPATG